MSLLPSCKYDQPLILFDGECGVCNYWVDYVIRRDPDGIFQFAPLQSNYAKQWLTAGGLPADYLDSIVLVDDSGIWTHSTAVLRVFIRLSGIHQVARVALWLPSKFRDAGYRWFARHRHKFFRSRVTCRLPSPEERGRFLK